MDLRIEPKPAIRSSVHTICPLYWGLYAPQAAPASCLPATSQVHSGMPAGFCSRLPPHLREASPLICILSTLIIPFITVSELPWCICSFPWLAVFSTMSAPRSEDGGHSFLCECLTHASFSASVEWFTDAFQDPEKFQVPVVGVVRKCFLEGLCEIKLEGRAEAQDFGKL